MPDQWLVLITNPVFIDEIRKMPDDAVDLRGGIDQVRQFRLQLRIFHQLSFQVFAGRYIHGKEWTNDPIHVRILYTKFNQALGETFPAVKDEIWHAFSTDIGHPEGILTFYLELESRSKLSRCQIGEACPRFRQ